MPWLPPWRRPRTMAPPSSCSRGYLASSARARTSRALADFTARAKALCVALTTSPAIVVAAVDGVAMGGGFELVLSADLVIASDRSRFGLPEIKLGLIPGWGGTQRLTRFLGPNGAKEAVLLGEPFDAERARQCGIVSRVVSPDELAEAAADLARQLAARAPLALSAGKAAVTAAYDPEHGADAGSGTETDHLLRLFASADGREGIAAFVEKRAAIFTGN
jgi:enoyl-CoA hydratase/carnithine racemase